MPKYSLPAMFHERGECFDLQKPSTYYYLLILGVVVESCVAPTQHDLHPLRQLRHVTPVHEDQTACQLQQLSLAALGTAHDKFDEKQSAAKRGAG